MSELVIEGLQVQVGGQLVLCGVDLVVASGEVHAVMGPNGSGKSTLAHALMGRPGYEVVSGAISLDGVDLLGLSPWQRAHAGLFSTQQYPTEVPGVALATMLEEAVAAVGGDWEAVVGQLAAEAERIGFDAELLSRSVNVDLSGGEQKRSEAVQLGVLRPRIAILDELDSGLGCGRLGRGQPSHRRGHPPGRPRRAGHHSLQPPADRASRRRSPHPGRRRHQRDWRP